MSLYDLALLSSLQNSRSKGNFSEFMERETWYTWDGTPEGKIALLEHFGNTFTSDSDQWVIKKLETDLIPILARMEVAGVKLDTKKLEKIGIEISEKIKLLEIEIFELTGEFFNISSPKQVAEILFGKLGIKPTKKNKTGYSVDTEVLEEIAKEYMVADLIIQHRSLSKLQSTYVESLLKIVDKKSHRVHTTYHQLGAATGRMSSNDPNLQNIPTGIGYASDIKSCFIPSDIDHILIVADYSQIEIRVLAWLSEDRALLSAFQNEEDIHMRTAKFLFGDDFSITSEQRRVAKTVNFWVIYGITGFGLSKTLGVPPHEATNYIHAFYEKYPWVRMYYDAILEEARKNGYVETAFGRRRSIPGVNDANKTIRSISEREAVNMPIQWTAADMIKLAMCDIDERIRDEYLDGKMILQVHDELVFDVPKSEEGIFRKIIQECMEGVLKKHEKKIISEYSTLSGELSHSGFSDNHPSHLPLIVDIHSGENWIEAKG